MRHGLIGLVLAAAMASGTAEAQTPPPIGGGPAAEYTAEFKVQGYGPKLRGRVYGAPGKERRESADPWGGATLIFRYDLGVAWTILRTGPYYTEFPLRPPGTPAPAPGAMPPGLSRLESDDINDVPATKYAYPGGEIWLSAEGIALRIDGVPRAGYPEIRFELDNLRVGPQDPALFELPQGYTRFDPSQPPPAANAQPQSPGPGLPPPVTRVP
jgi:hypothetical protein